MDLVSGYNTQKEAVEKSRIWKLLGHKGNPLKFPFFKNHPKDPKDPLKVIPAYLIVSLGLGQKLCLDQLFPYSIRIVSPDLWKPDESRDEKAAQENATVSAFDFVAKGEAIADAFFAEMYSFSLLAKLSYYAPQKIMAAARLTRFLEGFELSDTAGTTGAKPRVAWPKYEPLVRNLNADAMKSNLTTLFVAHATASRVRLPHPEEDKKNRQ